MSKVILTEIQWALLRLLRRWSVGSVDKFAEEMHLSQEQIDEASEGLSGNQFILRYPMKDHTEPRNKMLEITDKGIAFLTDIDGPIATFQERT